MKLLKVINQEKACELIKLGFRYTTENFDNNTLYVFVIDDALMQIVQKNFAKSDFFIERTMNF